MSKLTISPILSGFQSTSELNANFDAITDAIENTLSRDGTTPNSMSADVDMNSNDVLNANVVAATAVTIGGVSVVPGDTLSVPNASVIPNTPAGGVSAVNVQAAINELDGDKADKAIPTVAENVALLTTEGNLQDSGVTSTELGILDGATLTTTELNYSVGTTSNVQDQLDSKSPIITHRGALVYISSAQTATNGTNTFLTFDIEEYDTDDIHDNVTNNTRLTVPTGATKVIVSAKISWTANATGTRTFSAYKNGLASYAGFPVVVNSAPDALSFSNLIITSPVLYVTAGDYFEAVATQSSGGSLDVLGGVNHTWFSMEIVE